MTSFFLTLILLMLLGFAYNLWQLFVLTRKHHQAIEHLKKVFVKLSDKQHSLTEKITIANQFKSDFDKDVRVLNREIAELQHLLFRLISGDEQFKK